MDGVMEEQMLHLGEPVGGPYPTSGKIEEAKVTSVRVPLCLDLATIDSTMKYSSTPGGGGIGLAVDLHLSLKLTPASEWQFQLRTPRPVEHMCKCLASILHYEGAYVITSPDEDAVPFDATPELLTGVAAGMNASLGRKLGQRELRRVVSYNLAREKDGLLMKRPDTGVRVAGSLFGGLMVVTDELEIACRTPLPEGGSIILIPPNSNPDVLEADRMVQIDQKDREKKALEVLMKLMPAAIKSDVAKMGDSIYRLQLLGSKVAEIRRFGGGNDIYRLMSTLRVKCCPIVGVHDDTGIVAAYAKEGSLDNCLSVIDDLRLQRVLTKPDARGMKIALSL